MAESESLPSQPTALNPSEATAQEAVDPSAKFRGQGTSFRAKLIGIDDVPESRGDKMCQESINKLKENVKVSGQHKQKIVVNISMSGIKLIELNTAQVLHQHPVDRISFIARDMGDRRAFGYIYGDDDGNHHFFALKTAKIAEQVVLVLRDLFQFVFNMKKKDSTGDEANAQQPPPSQFQTTPQPPQEKQNNNVINLEQQMSNMTTSPVTPSPSTEGDMFGMAHLSDISSLSSDFSMASMSCFVQDSSKSSNQNKHSFRRTSSQKSAASWSGTTSSPFTLAQKRYTSLTVSRAKELKETLPDKDPSAEQLSKPRSNTEPTSSSTTEEPETGDVKRKKLLPENQNNAVENSPSRTALPDLSNDSFFDEVMLATGLSRSSTGSISEDASSLTAKATDNQIDSHSSRSSMSSLGSKSSSTRKSRSIGSLFTKSDKNKSSLKRKDNRSRKSSVSSVVSANENTSTSTSKIDPNPSPSTASPNQTSEQQKTTSVSEAGKTKSSSVRVRPSAAVARARPRAAMTKQASRGDLNNPPMFKNKLASASEPEEKPCTPTHSNSFDSPSSIRSSGFSKEERSRDSEVTSSPEFQCNSPNSNTWASFTNDTIANGTNSKSDIPFTESPWNTFPSSQTDSNSKSNAWNAFEQEASSEASSKTKPMQDINSLNSVAFSDDGQGFADFAFESNSEPKPIPIDPFSKDADIMLGQAEFESCDPFAEISPGNVDEDPFQNVEEMFDFAPEKKVTEKSGPSQSSENSFSNSSHVEKVNENTENLNENDDPFRNFEAVFKNSFKSDSEPKNELGEPHEEKQEDPFVADFSFAVQPDATTSNNDPFNDNEFKADFNVCKPNDDKPATPATLLAVFEDNDKFDTLKPPSRALTPVNMSRSNSISSYHSSATNASVNRSDSLTSGQRPDEDSSDKENNTFKANFDMQSTFQNPLSSQTPSDSFSSLSFPPRSPPPLPPRRPKMVNEPPTVPPPLLPPPPLPSHPDQTSDKDDESPSDCNDDYYSSPPDFEPPQLPPDSSSSNLPRDEFETPFDFNSFPQDNNLSSSNFNSSPDKLNQPKFSSEDDVFNLPLKPPSVQPPKIPKRNFSTSSGDLSSHANNAVYQTESNKTAIPRNTSYSDELAAFEMEALQPAANGGAKMTKDQILAGFGQGTPAAGMYQQQQQMGFFPPQQQSAGFGFPQQASFSNPAASNSMGVPFGAQAPVGGMFPGGPRPAVPVRSGGMRPSLGSPTMANPNPDPFGGVPAAGVLTPTNLQPDLPNGSTKTEEKSTYDPFASLVPGMSGASADKKNMFKDFKIAKPTSNGTDALASNPEPNPAAGDPFAGSNMNDTFNFQPQEQPNNIQSLFG